MLGLQTGETGESFLRWNYARPVIHVLGGLFPFVINKLQNLLRPMIGKSTFQAAAVNSKVACLRVYVVDQESKSEEPESFSEKFVSASKRKPKQRKH